MQERQVSSLFEALVRDTRHGVRSLRRDKAFTFTVMLTLAVAIAINAATFAIVRSVLLRPLPVPGAEDILLMSNRYPGAGAGDSFFSASGDYYDRLRELTTFEEQALFEVTGLTLEIGGIPEQVTAMAATPSLFRLLRTAPARGRGFTPDEGEIGAEQKVILSHGLWQQLYAGDPAAIGRDLRLGGRSFTVVGVMPPGFVFINPEVRLWVPLAFTAAQRNSHHRNNWYNIGRLKPGATIEQVQAQIDALNAANLERFPEWKEAVVNAGFHTKVEPLEEMLVRDVRGVLYLLWGGALFVLLIGALNVANLALVRLTLRGKELATRLALGAGRAPLTRQLVVESMLLTLAAGAAGLVLGASLSGALPALGLDRFPRAHEIRLDGMVILTVLAVTAAIGALLGLLPLTQAFRTNLGGLLQQEGRGSTGGRGARRVRQALVVAQVGFAFLLLAGAGLLLESFRQLLAVDPGYRTEGILTASTSAPRSRYAGPAELRSLIDRSLEAIRRLPGVEAAGATVTLPLTGRLSDGVILAEGYSMRPGESVVSPRQVTVTPGYLEAMNIQLLSGRYFEDRDNSTAPPVIIVDQSLANRFWPGENPIGRRMYLPRSPSEVMRPAEDTRWLTVAGVVRTARLEDLAGMGTAVGVYYLPYAQAESPSRAFSFAARTAMEPAASSGALRTAIAAVDPELALFDIRTMAQRRELSLSSRRASMLLAGGFGALALFLSAIGIYGLLAYHVTQRHREIGIRVALGSSQAGIARLVIGEGSRLAGLGLILGIAGALALHRAIENELYGVSPLDPLVMAAVVLLLAMAVLCASLFPALRAARVSPVQVLNQQ